MTILERQLTCKAMEQFTISASTSKSQRLLQNVNNTDSLLVIRFSVPHNTLLGINSSLLHHCWHSNNQFGIVLLTSVCACMHVCMRACVYMTMHLHVLYVYIYIYIFACIHVHAIQSHELIKMFLM